MIYIGIDPGQSGGLSRLEAGTGEAVVMPTHPKDSAKRWGSPIDWHSVYCILSAWKGPNVRAVVERSQAMPRQGIVGAFTYGGSYGGLLTVLQILQIPYDLVRPNVWKPRLLGDNYKTEDKSGAIRWCWDHYPDITLLRNDRCKKPHDGMADAICIAAYGQRFIK